MQGQGKRLTDLPACPLDALHVGLLGVLGGQLGHLWLPHALQAALQYRHTVTHETAMGQEAAKLASAYLGVPFHEIAPAADTLVAVLLPLLLGLRGETERS